MDSNHGTLVWDFSVGNRDSGKPVHHSLLFSMWILFLESEIFPLCVSERTQCLNQ